MTNKSVMTFISVNKISLCLSVCLTRVISFVTPNPFKSEFTIVIFILRIPARLVLDKNDLKSVKNLGKIQILSSVGIRISWKFSFQNTLVVEKLL